MHRREKFEALSDAGAPERSAPREFIKLVQSMLCRRVISHLARAILSSPQKSYRSSSSSTLNHLRNSFDNDVRAGSAVYQHALKFQRPAIIEWCEQLDNTVNLIGSVTRNPQVFNRKTGISGVHTSLRVKTSNGSSFWCRFIASFAFASMNCSM
ncbi:uncharacterized protein LOC129299463 isoform X1 [Prosopis cineraria]|uniref:uncharacterized protein LOC129299463 isoform X1 n=2 Tax=Prosopis cineraria TaxID=364024 RepID=UPI00240F7E54|nr:uncharacterized protein LOC129299463 isoform X1 [Prosopis cineraria]